MAEHPDFSGVAEAYSKSRPSYPKELFAWLASVVTSRDAAWDTATGNGQAALGLAAHFGRVIATDISEAQLLHATASPRVEYRVGRAEISGLPSHSVDLVVAAAALHWFDLDAFYEEARRVLRAGGVLAAWSYHVAHVEPPFDEVLRPFYRDLVGPYFAEGARLVDDRYEGVTLPGTALESPRLFASARWNAAGIANFVRTWSGVQAYLTAKGEDPVRGLTAEIQRVCGSANAVHTLRWPLYLRASRM